AFLLFVVVLLVSNVLIRDEKRQTDGALAREKEAGERLARTNEELEDVNTKLRKETVRAEGALADRTSALEREQLGSYFQKITLAERDYLANDLIGAALTLDDCPAALRKWEWRYLVRACAGGLGSPIEDFHNATGIALSPDRKRIVFVSSSRRWGPEGPK